MSSTVTTTSLKVRARPAPRSAVEASLSFSVIQSPLRLIYGLRLSATIAAPSGRRTAIRSSKVPDRTVTTNTGQIVTVAMQSFDCLYYFLMALPASLLCHLAVMRLNAQRFGEAARRESKRMPESVGSLGSILCDKAQRRMALVAGRHSAMARLDPPVIVLLHDVAVGAGRRIVSQI